MSIATVAKGLECNHAWQGTVLPMFEFKCISREAFEKNPHYMVYFGSEFVVTIWQLTNKEEPTRKFGFVGSPDFASNLDEFGTAQEALDFIKRNWDSDRRKLKP